jgi:asparaginyl-tRNA synthetase
MIEIEKRFSRSAKDIMDISDKCIKHCISYILTHCSKQMSFLDKFYGKDHISELQRYIDLPFIITHAEVVTMLIEDAKNGIVTFTDLPKYDKDLASEHEKYLTDIKYKHPVIVTKYPKIVKPFYAPVIIETKEESHGVEHVDSFDILVPCVGELVGGSQRIHKYDELIKRIDELGLDKKPLQFYIDLRKYGSVPHGGMGMGFERLISFITGASNVKDCVAFPKYMSCGKTT